MSVADRLTEIRDRIDVAATASGRAPGAVTLVVVTKQVGLDDVRAALAAGAVDLGENRAQELLPKAQALSMDEHRAAGAGPHWHFIGRLQRNKVRAVAPFVELWQSVDRADLALEVARRAPNPAVLVQVNVTEEPQKGGCEPGEAASLVETCREAGCAVEGLMTVPEATGDPRPAFAQLRRMADDLGLRVCSMGMSGDFEAAIAEGSTMVRVGTAIFGPRPGGADARR